MFLDDVPLIERNSGEDRGRNKYIVICDEKLIYPNNPDMLNQWFKRKNLLWKEVDLSQKFCYVSGVIMSVLCT